MSNSNLINRVRIHDCELIIDDSIHIEIPHIKFHIDQDPKGGEEGVVIFGYDTTLEREIVVKIWPPSPNSTISASIPLYECRKLCKLINPNIAKIYIADVKQGCFFAIMEKIEGKTLECWLKEDQSFEEKYDIFLIVTSTMQDVHKQGIYHGDLHLRNIIILSTDVIKIIDFGSSVRYGKNEQLWNESKNLINTFESIFSPKKINEFMNINPQQHLPEQILEAIRYWGQTLLLFRNFNEHLINPDDSWINDYWIRHDLFSLSMLMASAPLYDFDKIWEYLKQINVSLTYLSVFLSALKVDIQICEKDLGQAEINPLDASSQSVINSVREEYNHWKSVYIKRY